MIERKKFSTQHRVIVDTRFESEVVVFYRPRAELEAHK